MLANYSPDIFTKRLLEKGVHSCCGNKLRCAGAGYRRFKCLVSELDALSILYNFVGTLEHPEQIDVDAYIWLVGVLLWVVIPSDHRPFEYRGLAYRL